MKDAMRIVAIRIIAISTEMTEIATISEALLLPTAAAVLGVIIEELTASTVDRDRCTGVVELIC